VITRSLVTSFSTLLPIAGLMFFGGETLKDFAFALLVGVASGTYSSIFIATPVLTEWKERKPAYMRRRRLVRQEHRGLVPAFATGSIGDGAGVTLEAEPAEAAEAAQAAEVAPEPSGRAARMAARAGGRPRPRPTAPPPAGDGAPGDGADGAKGPPPATSSTGSGASERAKQRQQRRRQQRKKHGRR
jgi:SecD/SecF fusion protein